MVGQKVDNSFHHGGTVEGQINQKLERTAARRIPIRVTNWR